MATWGVPVNFGSPDFSFTIDLDGTIYTLRFVWNARASRWTMQIMDQFGNAIVSGVAVVTNWPLLSRFKESSLPPGVLFTADVTGQNAEPTDVNFGDTVILCYAEAGG